MQTRDSQTEKIFNRIKIALRVRSALWIDRLVMFLFSAKKGDDVLLVRTDAIGDYLLFRETFRKIRFSKKFADKKFILCGNEIWKDLYEKYDFDLAQECIWIDRKKMLNNVFYRFSVQKKIRQLRLIYAIEPTFSRLFLLNDAVMKVCCAEQKIADNGNTDNCIEKEKKIAKLYYTSLLDSGNEILFERERNFRFAEKLTGETFDRSCTLLPMKAKERENTVVFFIGASEEYKIWHFAYFASLGKKIFNKFYPKIYLLGSKIEQDSARRLMLCEENTPFIDLTGKTTLVELAEIIASARLLVSNETAAAHFGAMTGTKTLCIANGRHFGRFSPYPSAYQHIKYIFPSEIENQRANFEQTALQYCNGKGLNINDIKADKVFKIIEKMLSE